MSFPGRRSGSSLVSPSLISNAKAGKWSRANLQRGMELLHRDGLLAMTGIVDKDHLVALRDSMLKTAKEIRADKTKLTDFVRHASELED